MNGVDLNLDGTLKLTLISGDEGPDPAWTQIPDQERWQLIREFFERSIEFERRHVGKDVSLKLDKTQDLLIDLPISRVRQKELDT